MTARTALLSDTAISAVTSQLFAIVFSFASLPARCRANSLNCRARTTTTAITTTTTSIRKAANVSIQVLPARGFVAWLSLIRTADAAAADVERSVSFRLDVEIRS